ncbi:UMP-CMP kinase-like [Loxodonta africana]|uniref:UMP-CMP kinase-like n=1 Tax=Loxodonta africana TaxID=9785 RepID=UPI0030CDC704
MGLCKSALPQMGRPLRPQEKDVLKSPLIIFVMGGPGCGKGTQCKNMATKYGFCHVGLGHLLRQEAQRAPGGDGRSETSCCRGSWCPR